MFYNTRVFKYECVCVCLQIVLTGAAVCLGQSDECFLSRAVGFSAAGGVESVWTTPPVPLALLSLDRDPQMGVPSHRGQRVKGDRPGCKPFRAPLCTPRQIIIYQLAD